MIRTLVTAGLLAATIAAPASAMTTLTVAYAGSNASQTSFIDSSLPGFTLTASGVFYANVLPNALTAFGTPTAANVNRINRGIGVNGGAGNGEVDTATAARREMILLTGSKYFKLDQLTLRNTDAEDTLHIYGVNTNGTLVNFAFGTGTDAVASNAARLAGALRSLPGVTSLSADGGTAIVNTGINQYFTRYLLTTRVAGEVTYLGNTGQGFTLGSLTATVPEPATWAMLLAGFGLVGVVSRRRRNVVAA